MPIRGLLLGALFGIGLGIVLQQGGVWPLDRLLLFGLIGIFGLLGILLGHIGRTLDSMTPMVIALILALGALGFAATGLGAIGESGQLNGGCTVDADSGVDTTTVTDTSRADPFDVDPEGTLSWVATSPGPIMDHTWAVWVDLGGFDVTVASGGDPNTAGDQDNVDSVSVADEITYLEMFSPDQIQGVYKVGGFIDGTGGACDGFAFVRIGEGFLDTIISWIGAALSLVALVILLVILMGGLRGGSSPTATHETGDTTGSSDF